MMKFFMSTMTVDQILVENDMLTEEERFSLEERLAGRVEASPLLAMSF
jgi:hypothetical protein